MVCGPSGPELMTHLATASLGISQCRLGIPNKNVTKPRLESFEDTSFSVFQIAPAHLPKVRPAQPQLFHYSTSINHNFPHLHPLQAEPPKATPQLEWEALASETEPLASRRFARFQTELRVSGCRGPSWSSDPARALRWSSSACKVGCGWATAGWLPMPWRDGPSAVIRNRWKVMCWWRSVAHWFFKHQNLQIWSA